MGKIVHICAKDDWIEAISSRIYRTPSLEKEGFIHFSRPDQVLKVANTYYQGTKNLILLWVDINKVSGKLHWEESDGDIYPHLYGPLELNAIIAALDFSPDEDGNFRNLPDVNCDSEK